MIKADASTWGGGSWAHLAQAAPAPAEQGTRVVNARLQDIGREATRGADMPWGALLIAAGLIIAIVTLASVRRLHRLRDIAPGPRVAFLLATRRLGLNWRQRVLLVRIARGAGLSHAITLLLVPGVLHDSARQQVAGLAMKRRNRLMRRVSVIERLLYERSWPRLDAADDWPEAPTAEENTDAAAAAPLESWSSLGRPGSSGVVAEPKPVALSA